MKICFRYRAPTRDNCSRNNPSRDSSRSNNGRTVFCDRFV